MRETHIVLNVEGRWSGVIDRDKVIQHFQDAIEASGNNNKWRFVRLDIIEDAIKLLKAQEPRVLTLEELWHMEHKPVYLQRKNSRLYIAEPAILLKAERCYVPSLGESYIFMRENKINDIYWARDYNVTWRLWSAKPTDAQREVVEWGE